MATSLKYPTASETDAGLFDVAWNTITNCFTNNSVADTVDGIVSTSVLTDPLTVWTFGFAIPSTATIDGITAVINRKAQYNNSLNGGTVSTNTVQLRKSGVGAVGTNKATATAWGTTYTSVTFGGATDLWGTTWTPSEINDTYFGLYLLLTINCSTSSSLANTAYIDYITLEVAYTDSGASGTSKMFLMFE